MKHNKAYVPTAADKAWTGYEILLMGSGNPLVEEMMKCVNNYELHHLDYNKSIVTNLLIRAGGRILDLESELAAVRERAE